jgi:hypothetical protein
MVALGFGEILILFALAGVQANDVASLLEPGHYLKAHEVELKAATLAELATREARGGKEQMIQLLAIRWLGLHPDDARKAGAVDALRAVATGTKGQDPHGFARDYATRAMARIEGKPLPAARTIPAGSVRDEALSWFPAEATAVGAVDLRSTDGAASQDPEALSRALARMVPDREWKAIYPFVDAVGNLRLDRVALALEMEEARPQPKRIWIRFTGAGNLKQLEEFLGKEFPQRAERKGPRGEPIVIRTSENVPPALAFIGQTDVIIAGYQEGKARSLEVIEELLECRAGKSKSVVSGPFAATLKKFSATATAAFVADVPASIRDKLLRGGPFKDLPSRVVFEATGGKEIRLQLGATMKDADEAAAAAKTICELRQQGLQALKDLPAEVKLPREAIELARKALDGMTVAADGSEVTTVLRIPSEASKHLLESVEALLLDRQREP